MNCISLKIGCNHCIFRGYTSRIVSVKFLWFYMLEMIDWKAVLRIKMESRK